ncbi:MAG: bifunctional 4-hydroxy-3-methylbut-2-enyl diphosphate reductase/30S ribosomal protein S1 [Clostridiales bacterium]|nr:bifunctional 4-hydroxy-3-methylbut-2-enyl diphosphate reductase/30S ribosomal protein S1 [Clostridiales bacterium]
MNVIVARNAGFCFGVKRAVEAVCEHIGKAEKLYTYGPIIHNPEVVEALSREGVIVEKDVDRIDSGTVIIRSHGVPEHVYKKMVEKGLEVVDATCPYVKRVHKLVKKYHSMGYKIIIVGEKEHPEVIGINGWCNNEAFIINDIAEAEEMLCMEKACIVAQTTLMQEKWDAVLERVRKKVKQLEVYNTICGTTAIRQMEAESIAKLADAMIVIGGKNSSNTKKLFSICKAHCERTFAVQTAKDIDISLFDPGDTVGITAGASTPDWIIKEVIEKMNQANELGKGHQMQEEEKTLAPAEEMGQDVGQQAETDEQAVGMQERGERVSSDKNPQAGNDQQRPAPVAEKEETDDGAATIDDYHKTVISLRPGKVVKGTIISINPDEIVVNVGYKSDGILPVDELTLVDPESGEQLWNEGDSIEVEVVKVNDGEGNVLLSRKSIEERRRWKEIEEGFKTKKEFKGVCTEVVKGGVIAKLNGIRAFVPASHLSTKYIEDLNTLINTPLRLRIIELERRRNRVVASQRVILEEEEEARKKALWDSLEEGKILTGTVKRLTDFGAFVDIGGVDGLIHISDLSWGHVRHPSEVVQQEQTIEVKVLAVDRERERISLGYKQTIPHPWDNIEQKYPVGDIVSGKVVRITTFGAFVQLEPGVDGLVHISQISDRHIDKVEDVLKIGDVVQVRILEVDPAKRRISLSIREALPKQQEEAELTEDDGVQEAQEEMTVNLGEFFPDELKNQ